MQTCKEIMKSLEDWAPLELQEGYDNCGLIVGSPFTIVQKALISLDCTEAVVDEAIAKGFNMIISHHPLIFSGIKKLNGNNDNERAIIKAISNKICIYALHTNLDHVSNGVNTEIASKLGLTNLRVLRGKDNLLLKLVTFVPEKHADEVKSAMFQAGAGEIGNYSHCSFNSIGTGTFQAKDGAHPFVGSVGNMHHESEMRIEVVAEPWKLEKVIKALLNNHPYEEVAYDVYQLNNTSIKYGAGMIGEWLIGKNVDEALTLVKEAFGGLIRYTRPSKEFMIKQVAICGGSGSFLMKDAIRSGAQLFITSDLKYHQFFDSNQNFILFDIGHYENEQFTVDLIFRFLKEKFPTFAAQISEVNTNPIQYF